MPSNMSHIRIRESVDNPDLVEVPLERDGTLLLSTLIGQYPCSAGLRCKSRSGAWRGLRCTGNVIHPPDGGWGKTDYFVVFGRGDDSGDTGDTTGEDSSLKRVAQNDDGPFSKYQRTESVETDERPPKPTDDTPAQKAFQARLEIVQERWRVMNPPSRELLAKVEEFYNRPKKEPPIQTLREPGENYKHVEPYKRGFHVIFRQGLTRQLGRRRVVEETTGLLNRYHYQLTGGKPVHFEYKQLDNDENNTLVFIESDMEDPSMVTSAIYQDLLSGNCSQSFLEILKCWIKFLPVQKTCSSEIEDIVKTVKEVIEPVFQSWGKQRGLRFQMQVKGNNYIFRQLKFDHLQPYIVSRGAEEDCWSVDSELAIFVRVTESVSFVSLLRYNKSWDNYAVSKILWEKLGIM